MGSSRSGQRGQSASSVSIRSSQASTDEEFGWCTYATPPLAVNGAASDDGCLGAEVGKDVIEHGLTVEEDKISPDLLQVERFAIGSQKLTDVVDIAQAPGIVYMGLKLEADESLSIDYPQAAHTSFVLGGIEQQLHRFGSLGVKQVEPFVTAQIISGVFTAIHALVAHRQDDAVETVGIARIDKEIDITGAANNVMYRQCEPANQGWRRSNIRERGERFLHLVGEARHRLEISTVDGAAQPNV